MVIEEGYLHMAQLTEERDRALAEAHHLEAENETLQHRLRKADEQLRQLTARHEQERTHSKCEIERLERERSMLERSLEREEQRTETLERQVARGHKAEEQVKSHSDHLRDVEVVKQKLHQQVAQLEGLIKGWAPIVLAHLVGSKAGTTSGDHKQALRGQAALARARKTNLSPEAHLKMLEQVEQMNLLPPDLEDLLAELRSR